MRASPMGRGKGGTGCPCGMSVTQTALLLFLLAQIGFFYYLMRHHHFFQQSVYDLSGLVDSNIKIDQAYDLDRRAPVSAAAGQTAGHAYVTFPVTVLGMNPASLQADNRVQLLSVMGAVIDVDFPDLRHHTPEEVTKALPTIASELQAFDGKYKNPCWHTAKGLQCLPYAYLLGMPKSGTSDLFVRLVAHDQVIGPNRKEVRWLTRGEFTTVAMEHEEIGESSRGKKLLGAGSSVYSFTSSFGRLARTLEHTESTQLITIDGGPHTLWWPVQNADGSWAADLPPPQVIRLMQPAARFIVTLTDPVRRFWSDYWFIGDDLKPVQGDSGKGAKELHERAVQQVQGFKGCVDRYIDLMAVKGDAWKGLGSRISGLDAKYKDKLPQWIRASQMCAYDRASFARGGHGRIAIGLYSLHVLRWLEYFPSSSLLLTRLEDFTADRIAYMTRVYQHLSLGEPSDWKKVLGEKHANENHADREAMWNITESMLREFHRPYNALLKEVVETFWEGKSKADGYLWEDVKPVSTVAVPSAPKAEGLVFGHESLPTDHTLAPLLDPVDSALQLMRKGSRLRGHAQTPQQPELVLTPNAFDISSLPVPAEEHSQVFSEDGPDAYKTKGGQILCAAAFALDLAHLKYLLHTVGVPATAAHEYSRNAMHCLALVYSMGEAHSHSHIFAVLKGSETYLTPHIRPALPIQADSVSSRDILDGLDADIVLTSQWLLAAGVPVTAADSSGNTPLILAAYGGLKGLVEVLIAAHAAVNQTLNGIENTYHRTALHYAASQGHAEICAMLLAAGADAQLADAFDVTAHAIISAPGPIAPADALAMGIEQRPARQIARELNNTIYPHGSGGWPTTRLPGHDDLSCGVDMYEAHEISGDEIFSKYLAHNAPVLIRGLINDWPVAERYKMNVLKEEKGFMGVQASDIPYAKKFGGTRAKDMTLGEYIDSIGKHDMPGGMKHPWYVFKGHPIPSISDESQETLVPYDHCPTPRILQKAFDKGKGLAWGAGSTASVGEEGVVDKSERKLFVNAQWAVGGEGTGAPEHFHNTAWNALVYGTKKWVFHPPHESVMSNEQILQFVETSPFMKTARTCIQLAGEVMIIPENYGHGVLNIQPSIAIATEYKYSLFRIKPQTRAFTQVPTFNNREGQVTKGLATGKLTPKQHYHRD